MRRALALRPRAVAQQRLAKSTVAGRPTDFQPPAPALSTAAGAAAPPPFNRELSTAAHRLEEQPNFASLIEDLQRKEAKHVWHPMTQQRSWSNDEAKPPAAVHYAHNSTLYSLDGSTKLDAMGGLWCVNVGYGREELARVAYDAMVQLPFLSPSNGSIPQIELATKISDLLDWGAPAHAYFTASGSEANEAAFKIARQFHASNIEQDPSGPLRYKIISRHRAYHGNTAGAMAATGQAERKIGFGPQPPGYIKVGTPYPYRSRESEERHGLDLAASLDETIRMEGAETVAAFICEPITSGGGVLVPPENYLKEVRKVCDQHGVLLILDEVVSGFGRTGAMFGHHHYGVTPDIVTLAKGLTSGYQPLGACVVSDRVFANFHDCPDAVHQGKVASTLPPRLAHLRSINTYGGHPVACAVGLRNIEIVEREGLVERAEVMGAFLKKSLEEAIGAHKNVGEVRGRGLLVGVELVADRDTKTPLDDDACGAIVRRCADAGVVVGRNASTVPGLGNVLILAPPFVIEEHECARVAETLRAALDA